MRVYFTSALSYSSCSLHNRVLVEPVRLAPLLLVDDERSEDLLALRASQDSSFRDRRPEPIEVEPAKVAGTVLLVEREK